MTPTTLSDLLNELAHDAPAPPPAHQAASELWDAAHPRHRTLLAWWPTIAAAAAVVLLLVLLVFALRPLVTSTATPANQGDEQGALPSELFALPERVLTSSSGEWASTDAAIGRTSVATVNGVGMPVLVSAIDGTYHPLLLPEGVDDFYAFLGGSAGPSLSPDGWWLAYPRLDRVTDQATEASIGIVSLRSGAVTEVELPRLDGEIVLLDQLVWSADSHQVAWVGEPRGGADSAQVGIVSRGGDAPSTWQIATTHGSAGLAFAPAGDLFLAADRLWRFQKTSSKATVWGLSTKGGTYTSAVITADGTMRVGLAGSDQAADLFGYLSFSLPRGGAGRATPEVHVRVTRTVATPGDRLTFLGASGNAWAYRIARDLTDGSQSAELTAIVPGETVPLGAADSYANVSLSVAADLLHQQPRDFGEPQWPISTIDKVTIATLAALTLLGAVLLIASIRRRWNAS